MSDPHPGSSGQHGQPPEADVRLLPHRSFDHEQLRRYLLTHTFTGLEREMLENVPSDKRLLRRTCLFHTGSGPASDRSHYSHFQVYDVALDGVAMLAEDHSQEPTSKALECWGFIKDTPYSKSGTTNIRGRVVIAREPSPILLAALHLTHSPFMDMNSVFLALGSHETAVAHASKSIAIGGRKISQIIFSLSYYTVIGEECKPKEWQPHDEDVHAITDVCLSRCNTVITISLFNGIACEAEMDYGSSLGGEEKRAIPPWQILNLQCFPDWRATVDVFEKDRQILHGGDAFLTAVLAEFQDAMKRFEEIHKAIARLVIPSQDFIFSESLRDERLFDDASFVWTKQYFWALHVLPRINQSILEMQLALRKIIGRSDEWSTYISELWPDLPLNITGRLLKLDPSSKVRFQELESEFYQIDNKLRSIWEDNQNLIPQIQALQSTLFNGTSILESRKTVQQGENVKLLTMVNVFFLPLTFITSVFGMTNMPEDASFVRFGIVLVAVCLPLFGFIGFSSSQYGYLYMRTRMRRIWEWTEARLTVQKKEKRSLDPLQQRKRYGFSRKEAPPIDLEASKESFQEVERSSSHRGGNEVSSLRHIKKIVEDIGEAR